MSEELPEEAVSPEIPAEEIQPDVSPDPIQPVEGEIAQLIYSVPEASYALGNGYKSINKFMATQGTYNYALSSDITSSALVYTGPGCLQAVVVNSNGSSGTVKFWDSLTAANTVLFNTFTFATGSSFIPLFGAKFHTGLFATITGTTDITVVYTPYLG